MAYNLFCVQMAEAWKERIDKETAQQERFWQEQIVKTSQALQRSQPSSPASRAASTVCPSGYTSKTSFLKDRLERLESELCREREARKQVEADLAKVKAIAVQGGAAGSKPGTPRSP